MRTRTRTRGRSSPRQGFRVGRSRRDRFLRFRPVRRGTPFLRSASARSSSNASASEAIACDTRHPTPDRGRHTERERVRKSDDTSSGVVNIVASLSPRRSMFAATTTTTTTAAARAAIGFRAAVRGATRVATASTGTTTTTTTTTSAGRGRFVFTSTVVAGRKAAKIAAKSA